MRAKKVAVVALVGVVGISAVALWAGTASAQSAVGSAGGSAPGRPADRPIVQFIRHRFGRLMALKADLAITEGQREEIRGIVRGYRSQIAPAVEGVVGKRRALGEAVLAEDPDEQAIRSAARALGNQIADAAVLASKVAAEVKGVLTQEQIELIRQYQTDREAAVDKFLDKALKE
jgi:Spy/CpxP family protein refolding chaperone